jgi:hypothetical protein
VDEPPRSGEDLPWDTLTGYLGRTRRREEERPWDLDYVFTGRNVQIVCGGLHLIPLDDGDFPVLIEIDGRA